MLNNGLYDLDLLVGLEVEDPQCAPQLSEQRLSVNSLSGDAESACDDPRLARVAEFIDAVVQQLPEADRLLIDLHFGFGGYEPLSAEEIGTSMGVSAEAVKNSLDRALRRLRDGTGVCLPGSWAQ